MSIATVANAVGPMMTLMAILAIVESIIPLRVLRVGSIQRLATNLTLSILALAFYALLYAALVVGLVWITTNEWGIIQRLEISSYLALPLGVVLLDGTIFFVHWSMHRVPSLWRIHLVHHTDTRVDVTTSIRQHPIETFLRFGSIALTALIFGISPAALVTYRLLSGVNALFEHANIWTPVRLDHWISIIWVTPRMHKIHHSDVQKETDSNYGNLLSLFDRLVGTFTSGRRATSVDYGIRGVGKDEADSLLSMLVMPFVKWSGERGEETQ